MKCARCGQDIEQNMEGKTDVCGSCADVLRADADAEMMKARNLITFNLIMEVNNGS